MKVIFLDIDGVMNSELVYLARYRKRWLHYNTYKWWLKSKIKWIFNGFKYKSVSLLNHKSPKDLFSYNYTYKRLKEETDSVKWEWLNRLCIDTQAKICISSVWKNHFKDTNDWDKWFNAIGFPRNTYVGITNTRRTLRGTEIQDFLNKYDNIDNYVIIDDDSDMLPEQKEHFFQTDPYVGLTPNTCYRIKNYLNNSNFNIHNHS